MTLFAALWVVAQDSAWIVRPAMPTVGDTVWLERRITAPPGWSVRPGRMPMGGMVEPLGDPTVARDGDGWLVRYSVVAWEAGPHTVAIPILWRLGPGGEADSGGAGSAAFRVASVLPDTGAAAPRPPREPVRRGRRSAMFPLGALLVAGTMLVAAVGWRRRRPRPASAPPEENAGRDVADEEWFAAGEPGAVAARAAARLRSALARAVPEAHTGLTTEEFLAALARARPDGVTDEIAVLVGELDRASFGGAADGIDVAALAARARVLARRVAP